VPFVILLIKASNDWKAAHDGLMPSNFKDKTDFKENYLKKLALELSKELNFSEALKNAYLLFQDLDIPENLQEIFDSPNLG